MKPRQLLQVGLGVVTGIAGYLDAGTIVTSAAAGVAFGYQLLWVVIIGTICLVFLAEMAGRFAAVSKHTVTAALRERMGFDFFLFAASSTVLITVLTLSAEIGGVAYALHMLTGLAMPLMVIPSALLLWLILWFGTFSFIENGVAMLGLVTIVFATAAVKLGVDWHAVLHGFVPTMPHEKRAHYWFTVVGMLGALIAPYLLYFYSSGGVEDDWTREDIGTNRAVAVVGMGFGSTISMAVLLLGAIVLLPRGLQDIDKYDQIGSTIIAAYGHTGFYLFVASLFIACLGAASSCALAVTYTVSQGLGWRWGVDVKPAHTARFALVYTVAIIVSTVPLIIGIDPLKLTTFTMAITALALPITIGPFLVIMNDVKYLGKYCNGPISNVVVLFIIFIACLLAIVTIPLQLIGG